MLITSIHFQVTTASEVYIGRTQRVNNTKPPMLYRLCLTLILPSLVQTVPWLLFGYPDPRNGHVCTYILRTKRVINVLVLQHQDSNQYPKLLSAWNMLFLGICLEFVCSFSVSAWSSYVLLLYLLRAPMFSFCFSLGYLWSHS